MDTLQLTLQDLQTGFDEMETSPQDQGTVEMIVRRPAVDERELVEQAELDNTEGMIGDNWKARGSSSMPDGTANPEAQITLMNSRVVQLISQDRSRWSLAGDQIFVDLDLSQENLAPGQRIAIGSAMLEISELPHTGCAKFSARFGKDALKFISRPEYKELNLRGVNARIIQSGTIQQGDTISKV